MVPGADHLWELKRVLYDAPYPNEEKETPYEASPMRPSFRWTSPSIWQIRRISNPSSV